MRDFDLIAHNFHVGGKQLNGRFSDCCLTELEFYFKTIHYPEFTLKENIF